MKTHSFKDLIVWQKAYKLVLETYKITKDFPKEFIDKDKKVKFYLENADLYSYLPCDINQQIDDGRPD